MLHSVPTQSVSLISRILHEANSVGWDNLDAILANLIGHLSQTYEVTAGLNGNCLVTCLTHPHVQAELTNDAD